MRLKYQHIIKEWLFLSIVSYVLGILLWPLFDHDIDSPPDVWYFYIFDFGYSSVFCACVKAICHGVFSLTVNRFNKFNYFVLSASCCFMINLLMAFCFEKTTDAIVGFDSSRIMTDGVYVLMLTATFITFISLIYEHYILYAKQVQLSKHLELNLLKRQLDPHFMFNNLSTLSGMIGTDNQEAQTFIIKLSHIYRYISSHVADDVVSIAESVSFVKNYNEVLEVRHPRHFLINIAPELEHSADYVLPLSLQLLTENAIKHNKHSEENPLQIHYTREGDYIAVSNEINKTNISTESAKIGLDNLQKRYLLFCNRNCIISHTFNQFKVKIPIITQAEYESINHRR